MDEQEIAGGSGVPLPSWAGQELGQISPPGWSFCPIVAVSKYPYRYLSKPDSETVANRFFNEGKFWEREWEL